MKKAIFALLILAGISGAMYLYNTNSVFNSRVKNLFGYTENAPNSDSTLPNPRDANNIHKGKIKGVAKKLKPDAFTSLDDYARATPEKYAKDIPGLAAYLAIPAKNDLEKARLLFTWIATHLKYDADAYNTQQYGDCSATGVLKSRKSVCEGYSALFQELGTAMGLQVKTMHGYAKGYGYKPGDHFKETNHAWNLVRLDDHWKCFDVTWGSSDGASKKEKLVTVSRFEPYWFNINPREFIFTHLPDEEPWQLIPNKISLSQYEALPYLDESFFKLGFETDKVFAEAMNGKKGFVETLNMEYPIKIIQLPYDAELKKGKSINMIIHSDYAEQIVAIDDGRWTNFSKTNTEFTLACVPAGSVIQLALKINSFDKNYSTFAKYRISDGQIAELSK